MQAKHIKGIISLCAALIAGVALVAASGAGAAKAPRTAQIDVSTKASVVHYLRSIHVNAKGVVIQRGAHNYAGPNCPGKRWACASTKHTVVQVAKGVGKNVFRCRATHCAVVQISKSALASNAGTCIKTTGVTQSCTISQPNASGQNKAVVWMDTGLGKATGLTQTALYTADITQGPSVATGSTNTNKACVHQRVFIDSSTNNTSSSGATIKTEAHQSISVKQNSLAGANYVINAVPSGNTYDCSSVPVTVGSIDDLAPLSQIQELKSLATSKGEITQSQNLASGGANVSLDIQQNRGSAFLNNGSVNGKNWATFTQTNTLNAIANSPAGANQTQSSATGGILAAVNQWSTGESKAKAVQTETQCEDAQPNGLTSCDTNDPDAPPANYPLTQMQFGPVRKAPGDSFQTGNPNNSFNVIQTTNQDNDTQSGQKNTVEGGFHTDGNGSASQTATIDGSTSNQSQSGSDVSVVTNCIGPTCFTESGHQLTATNTKIAEFGYGGMRVNTSTSEGATPGDGTGSISIPLNSINGTVTKALLYWNGPTSSADPNSNAAVSFGGTPITGTNIGTAASNCWNNPDVGVAYTNTQSYRADVTDLFKNGLVGGGGAFALSDFVKTDVDNNVVSDINGVSLIVFSYDGNSANYRNVVLWSGNDSTEASTGDPAGWDETLTGVRYPGSGGASLDFVVGDGQTFADGAITVNSTEVVPAGQNFDGTFTPAGSGNFLGALWDIKSYALPSTLLAGLSTTGPNTLQITSPAASDCLSLVVAAANMPATAPTFLATAAAPTKTVSAPLPAASIVGRTAAPGGR